MLRIWIPLFLAAAGLPAAMSGCQGASGPFPLVAYSDDGDLLPAASGGGLVVDPDSPISDVPKPLGFVGVPSRSSASVGPGGVRSVVHVYQGRASARDAAAFYRRNLDDYGWELDAMDTGDPRSPMQAYVKGPETLRIQINADRAITTIRVNISPRAGGGQSS